MFDSGPRLTLGALIDRGAISIVNGFACGEHNSDGDGVLQLRPFNVTTLAGISLSEQKHVPAAAAKGKPTLTSNDIIFNNTNTKELVGKTAVWRGVDGCVFSNHMTRIRVHDRTIPARFLASAIHAHWIAGRSEMLARTHVAQASILGERFREIEIAWPSEGERMALATALDRLDESLADEAACIALVRSLKRAATRKLYSYGLGNHQLKETSIGPMPEHWDAIAIGDLGRVGNGSTPKRTIPEFWYEGHFPWLTSAKVYDRLISSADEFVTTRALEECHLPRVQPGAILMAITGQGKTLGHCAVLNIEASVSQHLAYMALDPSRANSSFVHGYLETQYEALRQVAAGGGSTKGALTCAYLRSLHIPLPPTLDEQCKIVAVLETIDRKIALHAEKRALLEKLFKSILHKLMSNDARTGDLGLGALARAKPDAA